MNRILLRAAAYITPLLLVLCAGAASPARADAFSFVTSGVFGNIPAASGCVGNGTNQITCSDGRVVVFTGTSFSQQFVGSHASAPGVPLGTFQNQNVSPSTAVGPIFPAGITLTITVTQTGPVALSGTLTAVMRVITEPSAAYNVFDFSSHLLVLESGRYRSTYHVSGFYFPQIPYVPTFASSVNNVPEPATALLLGAGLAGLGANVRRRARRR